MIEVAKEEVFVVINWTRQDEDNDKQSVALVSPTALKLTNCVQERLRQQAIKEKEKERTQFYQKQKEGQKDIRAKYREKVPSHFSQIISFRLLKWNFFLFFKIKLQKNVARPFSEKFKFLLFHSCKTMSKECPGQISGDDAVNNSKLFLKLDYLF